MKMISSPKFVGTFEKHIVFKESSFYGIESFKTIQFVE